MRTFAFLCFCVFVFFFGDSLVAHFCTCPLSPIVVKISHTRGSQAPGREAGHSRSPGSPAMVYSEGVTMSKKNNRVERLLMLLGKTYPNVWDAKARTIMYCSPPSKAKARALENACHIMLMEIRDAGQSQSIETKKHFAWVKRVPGGDDEKPLGGILIRRYALSYEELLEHDPTTAAAARSGRASGCADGVLPPPGTGASAGDTATDANAAPRAGPAPVGRKRGFWSCETLYNGVYFKSRLEAKWACFFDHIGASWGYEKMQAMITQSDGRSVVYTTDFTLFNMDCHIEVKPVYPSDEEMRKCMEAARISSNPIHLLYGSQPGAPYHQSFQDGPVAPAYGGMTFHKVRGGISVTWTKEVVFCIDRDPKIGGEEEVAKEVAKEVAHGDARRVCIRHRSSVDDVAWADPILVAAYAAVEREFAHTRQN